MIDKITPQRLDSSTDLKLTKKNAMVDALNVLITESSNTGEDSTGDVGVLKNPLGNISASYVNEWDAINVYEYAVKVIGSVVDSKTKVVYFFVYSSANAEHGVYAYDTYGNLPDGVPNSVRLIYKSNLFRFPQNGFVKADVVHVNQKTLDAWDDGGDEFSTDAIIYFTDNKNEPRKINAYRCMLSYYDDASAFSEQQNFISSYTIPEQRKLISACTTVPLQTITARFTSDLNYKGSNFKSTAGLQFAYQFVYRDGNESSISPYSSIQAPPVILDQGASLFVDYEQNNLCELTIPDWDREVRSIKIMVREGENNSFLLIDEVPANENATNWTYTNNTYKFYNDKVLVGVSQEDVDKTFDAIPKIAQAQTVEENRLMYGNYVEGFDNVSATATILPEYEDRDDYNLKQIKVVPNISPTNGLTEPTPNNPLTTGFILDFRELDRVQQDDVVRFSMSVAPDRNFHVSKPNFAVTSNKNLTLGKYFYESDPYDDVAFYTDEYDAASDHSQIIWGPSEVGALPGQSVTYRRKAFTSGFTNYNYTNPTIGSSLFNPLCIKGGVLTFSVEFTHTGADKNGETARTFLADVIYKSLIGEYTQGQDDITDVADLVINNVFTHSYDLGLENFDTLQAGYPNIGLQQGQGEGSALFPPSQEPDYRTFLINAVGDGGAYDTATNNNAYNWGPIGYFIMNKAKAEFSLTGGNDSFNEVKEVKLSLDRLYDVETATCIRRPSIISPWVVLTKDFWDDTQTTNQQKFEAFVNSSSVQLPSNAPSTLSDLEKFFYYGETAWDESAGNVFDFFSSASAIGGFKNFMMQFGELILSDNEFDTLTTCIYDGESGPGGYNGTAEYNRAQISKCGTVPLWIGFLNESDKVEYYNPGGGTEPTYTYFAGGAFFTGRRSMLGYNNTTNFLRAILLGPGGGAENQLSSAPIYKGGPVTQADAETNSASLLYFNVNQYNQDLLHPEIETVNVSFNASSPSNYYKSFKSSSNHEFGVVYFDRYGRHGFVNPVGTVYVPGYADQERQNEGKGRVYIQIQMTSNPPSWATNWKLVHSKSTSVESFIQYTSAGAYTRVGDSEEENERNIYVSLNYLQSSNVSYVSSFGARSPDGGVKMYKYQKGDRLRVLSYQNADGSVVYPYNYDFDIVDLVNLGEDQNPLYDADNTPDQWLQGDFVVLKNRFNLLGFDYVSVKNGSDVWSNNCVVELYRPSKNVSDGKLFYYEIGETFPVFTSQALSANDIQDTTVNRHGGIQLVNDGDVWWRRVAVNFRDEENGSFLDLIVNTEDDSGTNKSKSNFKDYWLETSTSTDLLKADMIGIGRVHTIFKDASEARRMASITYSLPTNPLSKRNFYGSFNNTTLNFKDLPEKYGFINYLLNRGDSILVFQDDKVSTVPIGRNIIEQASGENLVVSAKNVLGTARFYSGHAGTDGHPESVVEVENSVYFVHASSGRVYRYTEGSGLIDVTDKGMLSAIRSAIEIAGNSNGVSNARIVSGYDPLNEEYLLTIDSGTNVATTVFDVDVDIEVNFTTGCTDLNACNYDEEAQLNDGSCTYAVLYYDCDGNCLNDSDGDGICDELEIAGCQDPEAVNYDPNATDNLPETCVYPGCTDEGACNYDPDAGFDDNSCEYTSCAGCTDPEADNYDEEATIDNGSCIYLGCTDPIACNYDPEANQDDGSCTYPETYYDCDGNCLNDTDGDGVCDELEKPGCTDPSACNYDDGATDEDGSCTYAEQYYDCDGNCLNDTDGDGVCDELEVLGCTISQATNYDPLATNDDGSCFLELPGCHEPTACNYFGPIIQPQDLDLVYIAVDDGSCVLAEGPCDACVDGAVVTYDADGDGVCDDDEIYGCTDQNACNYDPAATESDGTCEYVTCSGCTDITACNYNPEATIPNLNECVYAEEYYDCDGNCLNDSDGDGVCDEIEVLGCTKPEACNYDPTATEDDGSCIFPSDCQVCDGEDSFQFDINCCEGTEISSVEEYINQYGLTYFDLVAVVAYLLGTFPTNQEAENFATYFDVFDFDNNAIVNTPDLLDFLGLFGQAINIYDPEVLEETLGTYVVEPSVGINEQCPVVYPDGVGCFRYRARYVGTSNNLFLAVPFDALPATVQLGFSYYNQTASFLARALGTLDQYPDSGVTFGATYTSAYTAVYNQQFSYKPIDHLIRHLISLEVTHEDIISKVAKADKKGWYFCMSIKELFYGTNAISTDQAVSVSTASLLEFLGQFETAYSGSITGFITEYGESCSDLIDFNP